MLSQLEEGGANYESKGRTPLPRVGPHSHGRDPAPQGRTLQLYFDTKYKKRKNLNRAMPYNSKRCKLSIDINYLSFDCMV